MIRLLAPWRRLVSAWAAGAAVMVAVLLLRDRDWTSVWSLASAAADLGVLLGAPVIAATACLDAQRRRRRQSRDLLTSTPRPVVVRRALELVRPIAVAMAVALCTHGVAWALAVLEGAAGRPMLGYPALTALTLAIAAVVGHAVGVVLRGRIVSLAVALAVFAAIYLVRVEGVDYWFVVRGWPQLAVSPGALVARAAILIALVLLVLLASRSDLMRTWSAAMALVATVTLASTAGPPIEPRRPEGTECTTGAVVVCLWPDNSSRISSVERAVRAAEAAVAGTLPPPAEPLLEEGLAGSSDAVGSGVTLRMGGPGIASSVVSEWLNQFPSCPAAGSWGSADSEAWTAWSMWVEGRIAQTYRTPAPQWVGAGSSQQAEVDAVLDLPEHEQVAWAAARAMRAQGCEA